MTSLPAVPSPRSSVDGNPRKRPRTACTRCKTRKQRCDNSWPTCGNCKKSGVTCDKSIVGEPEPSAYTRALENHVAKLEAELAKRGGSQSIRPPPDESPSSQTNLQQGQCRADDALQDVVNALNKGHFEAPAYVGSSSGLPLALNLGQMVQATVWSKALPTPNTESEDARRQPENFRSSEQSPSQRVMTIDDLRAKSAGPPSQEMGSKFIHAYFTQIHPRYPFLSSLNLWNLHADRIRLTSTRVEDLTKAERFGLFELFMIYAIGSMLLLLRDKSSSHTPERLYMTALQHISAARESRSVENVEAMALFVIYHLRSASTQGLWYMIGLATRTCIDMGLHRSSCEVNLDRSSAQYRRRLFWSVYSLERIISISLGRPCSIPDRTIDIKLPENSNELDPSSPTTPPPINFANALFKLHCIESRIYSSIYRADRTISSLRPKVDRYFNELESWRLATESCLSGFNLDYPMLHYNKAIRLLIQPFLPILTARDQYYQLCLRAAGEICQTQKRLHQSLDYGHSFIAVQTVFVAGITMLYCLWTSSHEAWSFRLSNDIRACSSVLFVMGERASWVRKYRDAFEILASATTEKLDRDAGYMTSSRSTVQTPPATVAYASIAAASTAIAEHDTGDDAALRMVMELANWIDHDQGVDAWMPDFESLENLTGSFDL